MREKMVTNLIIGDSVKLEISSNNQTVLLALSTNEGKEEITFPLSADETDVLIAALIYNKKRATSCN